MTVSAAVLRVLADRYFSGYPQVARIASTGADLIVRVQYRRRLPVLRELPDGSYLSVLPHSGQPSKAERDRARGQRLLRRGLRARQPSGCRSGSRSTPSPSSRRSARPAPSLTA